MLKTCVFNWVKCRWVLHYLSAGARAHLRHLTFGAVIACGGVTVIPPGPPVEAHSPPPPAFIVPPPPAVWAPPPGSPWQFVPPIDSGSPPVMPIPLGPVLQPSGVPEETFGTPRFETAGLPSFGPAALPPICDTTPPVTVTPGAAVPEPSGIALIGFGLLALGAIVMLRRGKPVEVGIRFVVLEMADE